MSITPNYVPREYKTINVLLMVKDAHRALEFYNRAFGAEVVMKLEDPNGVIIHAEMRIDDTIIMLAETSVVHKDAGVVLQLYTGDVEGLIENAIKAGAEEITPIEKQFYGDRAGRVKDPFGHHWIVATHVEDLSARELQKRFNELYS
jgi:PhnB protein